ncbi:glycosyltransferase [Rhizobium sp. FKL33]|uniref:glycosyltransferase n=1 Tax=Rhizobium sp. FKL33 TaxID=2562307 RepID=UPI0010C028C3|nr:glycosyltransferase [Rhizobium sp. FKL33]
MKVEIWHNILWSRYKAVVFTELHRISVENDVDLKIYQIAETDSDRVGLSGVEKEWHGYPYKLLFGGSYSAIPRQTLISRVAREAFKTDADIIALAGFERPEYWIQLLILKARRKKVVFFCDSTIYDNEQTLLKGLAKRFFFRLADAVFCYGVRAKEYLMHYGMPARKIRFRRQAAALPRNYDPATVVAARIAQDPGEVRLLYVGRLALEKRVDTLLKAFKNFLQLHGSGRLVIVGKGPEEQELQQLAEEMAIIGNVDFVGGKSGDALWAEYLAASALVLPSQSEPWGLVVNEALAYGCPVIVSQRCGCVPELVIEGKTGYAFECDNVDDLLKGILAVQAMRDGTSNLAETCIDHIASFSPSEAAREIYNGLFELVETSDYSSRKSPSAAHG